MDEPAFAPPAPNAEQEEDPLAEERALDAALFRAAEEQRAAARTLRMQPEGKRSSILGFFERIKARVVPAVASGPTLSISERIARDFDDSTPKRHCRQVVRDVQSTSKKAPNIANVWRVEDD